MGVSRCGTYLFATYKKIRCAIYSGQLSAGEKIPSVREMAKILHINPNTVMRAYKIVSNDKSIVSYRNGQYSVTTDEQYIAKKREDTAKVLCFSYFDNMFALGFSKDEAENIRSEDAGETKDQASGSKFIKFYGKSR